MGFFNSGSPVRLVASWISEGEGLQAEVIVELWELVMNGLIKDPIIILYGTCEGNIYSGTISITFDARCMHIRTQAVKRYSGCGWCSI